MEKGLLVNDKLDLYKFIDTFLVIRLGFKWDFSEF